MDRLIIDTRDFAPLRYCLSLTTPFKNMVRAGIVVLLLFRSPPTIIFGIPLVVVYAIDAHVLGAFAHIGKELLERSFPFRADVYSPTSITGEVFAARVSTAFLHLCPDAVNTRTA